MLAKNEVVIVSESVPPPETARPDLRLDRRIGVRGRLILLLLLAFALMCGVIVWQAIQDRNEHIGHAEQMLLAETRIIAAQQQRIVAQADAILTGLMQLPEVRPGASAKACAQVLAARLEREPGFVNLGQALPDGDVACATAPSSGRVSYADRNWFRQALQSDRLVVGDVVTGRVLGKPVIALAKAMRDEQGRVTGVLYLSLDLAWLHRELIEAKLPEGARLGVLDARGMVAVRHPDPEDWVGKSAADQPLFEAIRANGGEGALEVAGLDGVVRINGFTPLLDSVSGPMTLWLNVPKAQVTALAERDLAVSLAIALATLFATLGLVIWGGNRMVARPLLALSRTAARFGAGDHGARSGLPHTDDEIGRLARMLDTVAESIQAGERKLFRANRALRVLSAGNRTLLRAAGEQALLEAMCRAVVDAGEYRMAWVGYAEHDREKSIRPMASSGIEPGFFDEFRLSWAESPRDQSATARAIRHGVPVIVHDVASDPVVAPWRDLAQRHGIASWIALPLRIDGAIIGALVISAAEPEAFDEEETLLLGETADDLAYGIATQRAAAAHDRTRGELKQQEQRTSLILKAAGEGIFGLDREGRCTFINPAAAEMLQWPADALVGQVMHALHHHTKADGTPHPFEECPIHAAYLDGATHREADDVFWRKDGTRFPVEYVSTPMRDEQGELMGAVVSFADMSERKAHEKALARAVRALKTLSAGNKALVRATDELALLQAACRVAVEVGGYRMAWVGFADDNPEKTVTPKAWAGIEEGYLSNLNLTWADAEHGQGPASRAIRNGEPVVVHDIAADPGMVPFRELAIRRGYASAFAFPLRVDGRVIGALGIYAAEQDAFDDEEVELLEELGGDLAFGVASLRTRTERDRIAYAHEHHAEMLQKSLEQSIQAIADIVEARDPYTAGHERRVGELAVAIAREMGLAEERIHGIRLAAGIHDLGKIKVPAEILAKPGKLTDVEFMLIKTHPQAGYDILKDVDFPWPIADMVWQHHERLDGSGYPQGLQDGPILLESRIMTVADVVEAMASHRPYRAALGIETALKEIERGRGSAYDPTVADACLKLFREGRFAFQG